MKPLVIGIAGKIGAGKDAIAEHLVVKYTKFAIVRFSDALKDEVFNTLPRTLRQIYRYVYQGGEPDDYAIRRMLWVHKPPIVRELLQEWGTELRRAESPGYWVEKWMGTVLEFLQDDVSVVTPDLRFPDELGAVLSLQGIPIRVTRPNTVVGEHPSETSLDGYALFEIDNSGTLSDLYEKVDTFIDGELAEDR